MAARHLGISKRNRDAFVWTVALTVAAYALAVISSHLRLSNSLVYAPAVILIAFPLVRTMFAPQDDSRSEAILIVAYLPIAAAAVAYLLVPMMFQGIGQDPPQDLANFYGAMATVLAALLIALVVESRSLAALNRSLRALRMWWTIFIVAGLLAALYGLTPGHSPATRLDVFEMAWGALVGALTAGALVMGREWFEMMARQPGVPSE